MRLIDADALLAKYPDCRDLKRKVDEMPTVRLSDAVKARIDELNLNACWHCRFCNQDVNDDPCYDCFKTGRGNAGSAWEWELSELLEGRTDE